MTDDLVKRLRKGPSMLAQEEAADRIEELDKDCCEWAEVSQNNFQRAKTAETKLEIAITALKTIRRRGDALETFDFVTDSVATAALKEIEGLGND